ncbi:MAG: diguanylate cyclase, partial [Synergistaceae bacterium]|nr:diguanylate cyclase [Synergistaceae bacterium]
MLASVIYLNNISAFINNSTMEKIHGDEKVCIANIANHINYNKNYLRSLSLTVKRTAALSGTFETDDLLRERVRFTEFDDIVYISSQQWNDSQLSYAAFGEQGKKCVEKSLGGEPVISDIIVPPIGATAPRVIFATPVKDSGKVTGVLVATYMKKTLDKFMNDRMVFTIAGSYCYIVQQDGAILASTKRDARSSGIINIHNVISASEDPITVKNMRTLFDDMRVGRSGSFRYWEDSDRILSYAPVGINGWYLLTSVPFSALSDQAKAMLLLSFLLILAVLMALLMLGLYIFKELEDSFNVIESANEEISFLYNAVSGGIVSARQVGEDWEIVNANDGFYRTLGYTRDQFKEKVKFFTDVICAPTREDAYDSIVRQVKENGRIKFDICTVTYAGEKKWVRFEGQESRAKYDQRTMLGILTDIDSEKKALEAAVDSSMRDSLTNLWNKASTEKLISERISNLPQGEQGVFILLDIDNFKNVNDSLGHLFGDAVISELARSLRTIFRDTDIVGRVGGDEFVVFMSGIKDMALTKRKIDEVHNIFRRTFKNKGRTYPVSCTIGFTLYPEHGTTYEELMDNADTALYIAKRSGKDTDLCYCEADGKQIAKPAPLTAFYADERPEDAAAQKNFRDNIAEYILKIFYEYNDTDKSMDLLLDFVGNSFNVGRIEVATFSDDASRVSAVYEWCKDGVASTFDQRQNIPS